MSDFDEASFLSEVSTQISRVLSLHSQILRSLKPDADFGSASQSLDFDKLDRLTALSRSLFSDVVAVSDRLHAASASASPAYTRLGPFHSNVPLRASGLETFSYSLPLELRVSAELARLQAEFLGAAPRSH